MNRILKRIAKILSIRDPKLKKCVKDDDVEVNELGYKNRDTLILTYGDEIIIEPRTKGLAHSQMFWDLKKRKDYNPNKLVGFAEGYGDVAIILDRSWLIKNN